MRPPRFEPVALEGQPAFLRDSQDGRIYHRVFNRVLYADTDRSGVVYHANYLRYFELGRSSMMRDLGYPYAEVEASGFVYPVVDTALKFFQPLFYDSPMYVYTCVAELERIRVRFEYVITQAETGAQVCRGYTLHCALDRKSRPVAVDPLTARCFSKLPK